MSWLEVSGQVDVLWPRMLWLLLAVPALVGMYVWLAARRRTHGRGARLALADASASGGRALRRHLPPLLYLVGLAALVGAIARPQAMVMLPSMHKDVILAIDTSGSMRATDVKPNRLSAAQAAARAFVESRPPHTRVGIVAFAGSASLVQSLTDNRQDLLDAIERLQLQRGTALGSGIYIALATLLPDAGINLEQLAQGQAPHWGAAPAESKSEGAGSNRSAAIVLLSDGEYNHGPEPLEAAKLASEHGVRIYTVGVGTKEGTTLGFGGWSMRVRLDEDGLRRIAALTHGEYYAAGSAQQLKSIYEHLSARMVVERSRTVEITAFLLGLGALMLAAAASCSVLWFNRVL